jgi:hypothetical protein
MPRVASSRETEKVWNTVQRIGGYVFEKNKSDQVVSPAEQTDNFALLGSNCPE